MFEISFWIKYVSMRHCFFFVVVQHFENRKYLRLSYFILNKIYINLPQSNIWRRRATPAITALHRGLKYSWNATFSGHMQVPFSLNISSWGLYDPNISIHTFQKYNIWHCLTKSFPKNWTYLVYLPYCDIFASSYHHPIITLSSSYYHHPIIIILSSS